MWCKAECSSSLLQSSVSHDSSEVIHVFCINVIVFTVTSDQFNAASILNKSIYFFKNSYWPQNFEW